MKAARKDIIGPGQRPWAPAVRAIVRIAVVLSVMAGGTGLMGAGASQVTRAASHTVAIAATAHGAGGAGMSRRRIAASGDNRSDGHAQRGPRADVALGAAPAPTITVSLPPGIAALSADQVTLEYETSPDSGVFQQIPLADNGGGALNGYYGPPGGFTLPPGYSVTTRFRVGIESLSPTGTLAVSTTLDQVDAGGTGAISDTLAATNGSIVVSAPAFAIALPVSLTAGDAPTTFTGVISNTTPATYTGVRVDFDIEGIAGLRADQVDLEYETSPDSGVFQQIPLADDGSGALTGFFGPVGGFTLPPGASNTTRLRVGIAADAPAGTLSILSLLDVVDSGGDLVDVLDFANDDVIVNGAAATGTPTTNLVATGTATTGAATAGPTGTATASPPAASTSTGTAAPTGAATSPPPTSTGTAIPPATTNTAVPPTSTTMATPTATATATLTATSTPTATPTSVPPTSTSTNTAVPPIATSARTAVPSSTSTAVPPTSVGTVSPVPSPAVTRRFCVAGGGESSSAHAALALLNPTGGQARVVVTFYFADGGTRTGSFTVPANAQRSYSAAGLAGRGGAFGLCVASDRAVSGQLNLTRPGQDGDSELGSSALGSHWSLAEGYTSLSFHESVALLNPNNQAATVALRLLLPGGRGNRTVTETVGARSERVVDINALAPRTSVSIVADASRPVLVERTLTFSGNGYGLTARDAAPGAATSWLFAEGSTRAPFQTFLTVLNPQGHTARVTASFFGVNGRRLGGKTLMLAPRSRATLLINTIVPNTSNVASVVTSDRPVVVERPEYFGSPNARGVAGSDVVGRVSAARRWAVPGGPLAAGDSEFLLLYNPSARAVPVDITFYNTLGGGTATARVTVPAGARSTFDVSAYQRRSVRDRLAASHGTILQSRAAGGVVVERSVFGRGYTTLQATQGLTQ